MPCTRVLTDRLWDVIHILFRLDPDVMHTRVVGRIGVPRDSHVALDYTD